MTTQNKYKKKKNLKSFADSTWWIHEIKSISYSLWLLTPSRDTYLSKAAGDFVLLFEKEGVLVLAKTFPRDFFMRVVDFDGGSLSPLPSIFFPLKRN